MGKLFSYATEVEYFRFFGEQLVNCFLKVGSDAKWEFAFGDGNVVDRHWFEVGSHQSHHLGFAAAETDAEPAESREVVSNACADQQAEKQPSEINHVFCLALLGSRIRIDMILDAIAADLVRVE